MSTLDYTAVYTAAMAADSRWSAELVRIYGAEQAGDARYDDRGTATPYLSELRAEKKLRDAALRASWGIEPPAPR